MKKILSMVAFLALVSSSSFAIGDAAKNMGTNAAAGALSGKSGKEIANDAKGQAKDAAKKEASKAIGNLLN